MLRADAALATTSRSIGDVAPLGTPSDELARSAGPPRRARTGRPRDTRGRRHDTSVSDGFQPHDPRSRKALCVTFPGPYGSAHSGWSGGGSNLHTKSGGLRCTLHLPASPSGSMRLRRAAVLLRRG